MTTVRNRFIQQMELAHKTWDAGKTEMDRHLRPDRQGRTPRSAVEDVVRNAVTDIANAITGWQDSEESDAIRDEIVRTVRSVAGESLGLFDDVAATPESRPSLTSGYRPMTVVLEEDRPVARLGLRNEGFDDVAAVTFEVSPFVNERRLLHAEIEADVPGEAVSAPRVDDTTLDTRSVEASVPESADGQLDQPLSADAPPAELRLVVRPSNDEQFVEPGEYRGLIAAVEPGRQPGAWVHDWIEVRLIVDREVEVHEGRIDA